MPLISLYVLKTGQGVDKIRPQMKENERLRGVLVCFDFVHIVIGISIGIF